MAEPLYVDAAEFGWVRVFAVDIDTKELRAVLAERADTKPKGAAFADFLGVDWIIPEQAELFDVADLDDFGLTAFLREGADIAPDQIEPFKAKLDSYKGVVLVVYSKAFEGKTQDLDLARNVSLLGHFQQRSRAASFKPLPAQNASGAIGATAEPPKSAHLTLLWALLALPITCAILGLLIWVIIR